MGRVRQYILSLTIAFALLILSSLIFFSYRPERAVAVYAVLSCPLSGFILSRTREKNKILFASLCGIIILFLFVNIPMTIRPIKKYHDTVITEGNYDKVGRFLKTVEPDLDRNDIILVELTDEWREYYLFYYLPDRLAFDKSGKWYRPWRKTLFPASFRHIYLGYEKEILADKDFSLFNLPLGELARLFKKEQVAIIVVRSAKIKRKMEKLFKHKIRIADYTLFSNQAY